jgi:hypothetical protein
MHRLYRQIFISAFAGGLLLLVLCFLKAHLLILFDYYVCGTMPAYQGLQPMLLQL